jgi:hypothetical protein
MHPRKLTHTACALHIPRVALVAAWAYNDCGMWAATSAVLESALCMMGVGHHCSSRRAMM